MAVAVAVSGGISACGVAGSRGSGLVTFVSCGWQCISRDMKRHRLFEYQGESDAAACIMAACITAV
jgi:hypothetical protein